MIQVFLLMLDCTNNGKTSVHSDFVPIHSKPTLVTQFTGPLQESTLVDVSSWHLAWFLHGLSRPRTLRLTHFLGGVRESTSVVHLLYSYCAVVRMLPTFTCPISTLSVGECMHPKDTQQL